MIKITYRNVTLHQVNIDVNETVYADGYKVFPMNKATAYIEHHRPPTPSGTEGVFFLNSPLTKTIEFLVPDLIGITQPSTLSKITLEFKRAVDDLYSVGEFTTTQNTDTSEIL